MKPVIRITVSVLLNYYIQLNRGKYDYYKSNISAGKYSKKIN